MITNLLQEKIKRKTILVVDDTPDNLTFISGLLKDDYRVKVANNGQKAITIARSNDPPDLILLDIMMPGMDGYDVCRIQQESNFLFGVLLGFIILNFFFFFC